MKGLYIILGIIFISTLIFIIILISKRKITKCDINEILINGTCIKCPIENQCNNTCISNTQVCDSKQNFCDKSKYNPESKLCCDGNKITQTKYSTDGTTKKIIGYECCENNFWADKQNICCDHKPCNGYCCDKSKGCDISIKDKNPCRDCNKPLCGGKECCNDVNNEMCFYSNDGPTGPIQQYCCDPKLWDPDKKVCCTKDTKDCTPGGSYIGPTGPTGFCPTNYINCGNVSCCNPQQRCIGTICCDSKNIAINEKGDSICYNQDNCHKLKDKDEYLCCTSPLLFNEDKQECGIFCGTNFCDSNQSCQDFKDVDGKIINSKCINNGCTWNNYTYNPPLLNNNYNLCSINYGTQTNPSYKYYTVSDPDDLKTSGKFLERIGTTTERSGENLCTEGNCNEKISEIGAVEYSFSTDNTCSVTFDCKSILPSNNNKCILGDDDQCCFKTDNQGNKIYTGQICMDSAGNKLSCYSGPQVKLPPNNEILSPGDCICDGDAQKDNCKVFNNTTCNKQGTPDYKNGICICNQNSGYIGNYCQYSRNNTCSNNGFPDLQGNCTCDPGYIGSNCATEKDLNWIVNINNTEYFGTVEPKVEYDQGNGKIIGNITFSIGSNMYSFSYYINNDNNMVIYSTSFDYKNNIPGTHVLYAGNVLTYDKENNQYSGSFFTGPRYSTYVDTYPNPKQS